MFGREYPRKPWFAGEIQQLKHHLYLHYTDLISTFAYDIKSKKPNAGIKVVPLDLNSNNKIDADENFYNNLDDLLAAIASGKYPSPPARDLYLVTKGKPTNPIAVAFIKWILTNGQKYVGESGYVKLSQAKIDTELKKVQ